MLRKSGSARGAPPEADETGGGNRSWAAMRARLRQGREPIFGAPAVEPPPPAKPASSTSHTGHNAPASDGPAKPVEAAPAPAQPRQGFKHSPVGAVRGPAASEAQPAAGVRTAVPNELANSEASPPPNGTDHGHTDHKQADLKGAVTGNGADRPAQTPSPAIIPGSAVSGAFESRPDSPGARIGRVISVAGPLVWGMIEAKAASTVEIGAVVRLEGASARTFGVITTLKSDGRRGGDEDRRLIEIRLLGEILNAGPHRWRFQRGVSSHPALDSAIHAASREELCAIYARPEAPTVRLGTLKHAPDLPAFAITDNLLGKHFAVLGTTGAGKSCAVTVILRAILDANPYGHVIMLDPHNEYKSGFGDRAELLDPSNLKLPYWLLNFEEIAAVLVNQDSPAQAYAEGAILRNAILQARRAYFGKEADTEYITESRSEPRP